MTHSRGVVIVAYYFPPDGGAGAQRPLKFAKYLSESGTPVTVVTHAGTTTPTWSRPRDPSLVTELDKGFPGRVVRVAESKDDHDVSRWALSVTDTINRIIDRGEADTILYTMSPFALTNSARLIAERHPEAAVILDFRDPWALDGWQPQRTYFHWRRAFHLMRDAVERANGVIANTPECGRLFLENFHGLKRERLAIITNGFDQADFSGNPGTPTLWAPAPSTGLLRIVFSGSLCTRIMHFDAGLKGLIKRAVRYRPERLDISGRTLIHVMEAINLLRRERDPLADRIRIEVLGVEDKADRQSVEAAGFTKQVCFHGYVPHDESVRHIRLADVLLLPLHGLPVGVRSRIVPGKTYEYLATGRPILGLLPEGDARDFVAATDRAAIADPCDPAAIARAIKLLPGLIEAYPMGSPSAASIQRFERRRLSEQLTGFITHVHTLTT